MSEAAGAKKLNESQRAKAPWAMKAAKDSEEDFYDPARKDKMFGKKSHSSRAVERAPERSCWSIGQSSEVFGESVSKLVIGSRLFVKLAVSGLWPRGLRYDAKDGGQTAVGRCLDLFGSVRQRAFAHSLHALECAREVLAAW